MRRKVFSVGGVALATLLAVLAACPLAAAQAPASSDGAAAAAQISQVLHQGRQLETDRRWGEALSLYEDAVRKFPDDRTIRVRFDVTRLHYDLARRYDDRSFRGMASQLSAEEALDIYDEVLLKIQTHHVEAPDWKDLIQRGANALDVALTEPVFLQAQAPGVDAGRVEAFREESGRHTAALAIQTRNAARAAVAMTAALAAERLGVPPAAVVLEYVCGATNGLDLYSAYLTPAQLAEVYSQIEGNFVGLGIELKAADGAGLVAGDSILSVDGCSTQTLTTEQAADLLQGDAGSVAELVVKTPRQDPRTAAIRRERIDVPSIDDVKIVDPPQGVGYVKLACFQKGTAGDLDAALWSLHRQGMRSLIVDLRGNPGGLLVTAVEVVDKFVGRGVIVSTHGRSSREDFTYSAHARGTWGVPLVVLIDQDSASAAEIFAGAIRDHRRGTIVGQRSFGKGSVQGIFPLSNTRAGVRLTTAKFYSPSGHPYSGIGVEPDLVVHQVARPTFGSVSVSVARDREDPMLAAAVQAAKQLTAQR
jgi:carboxyl-terminal processing protease